MTRQYYVLRKADDLKLGNMYCHWAQEKDGKYYAPRRILAIQKTRDHKIKISLDDCSHFSFNPEHQVVIAEMA